MLLTDLGSVLRDVLGLRGGFWVSHCGYGVRQGLLKEVGNGATKGIVVFLCNINNTTSKLSAEELLTVFRGIPTQLQPNIHIQIHHKFV